MGNAGTTGSELSGYDADGRLNICMKHFNIQDGARAKMPYPKENDAERKERTGLSSLEITDQESKAVQKTPNRVALADIESAILHVEYINTTIMPHLTIAVIYLQNGWAEVGHSAPADADNFDAELGKKFAYENALRKLWPLFGFALREKLSWQGSGPPVGEPTGSRPFNPTAERDEIARMTPQQRHSAQRLDEEG